MVLPPAGLLLADAGEAVQVGVRAVRQHLREARGEIHDLEASLVAGSVWGVGERVPRDLRAIPGDYWSPSRWEWRPTRSVRPWGPRQDQPRVLVVSPRVVRWAASVAARYRRWNAAAVAASRRDAARIARAWGDGTADDGSAE